MDPNAKRLLVFGASGYTGQALVAHARREGNETHAHFRPNSPRAQRLLPQFEALQASCHSVAWTAPTIAELIHSVAPTHVFCLLGTTKKKAAASGEDASYASVDVGMTLMVLEAVATSSEPARFIYLSAAGVNAKARGAYLKARWEVEHVIRQRLSNWVIARPSFITGPDRAESRPGERVGALVSDGLLGFAGAMGFRGLQEQWGSLRGTELASGLVHHAMASERDSRTVDSADLRGHA